MKTDYLGKFNLTDEQKTSIVEGYELNFTSYNWQYGFQIKNTSGDVVFDTGHVYAKPRIAKKEAKGLVGDVLREAERQAS